MENICRLQLFLTGFDRSTQIFERGKWHEHNDVLVTGYTRNLI